MQLDRVRGDACLSVLKSKNATTTFRRCRIARLEPAITREPETSRLAPPILRKALGEARPGQGLASLELGSPSPLG